MNKHCAARHRPIVQDLYLCCRLYIPIRLSTKVSKIITERNKVQSCFKPSFHKVVSCRNRSFGDFGVILKNRYETENDSVAGSLLFYVVEKGFVLYPSDIVVFCFSQSLSVVQEYSKDAERPVSTANDLMETRLY